MSELKKNQVKLCVLYDLASEVTHYHLYNILLIIQVTLIQCSGRGHKDMSNKREGKTTEDYHAGDLQESSKTWKNNHL